MATQKFYLTNKDLMREIHNSKLTYCWIKDDKYRMYDLILDDLDEIDDEIVVETQADGTVIKQTNLEIARKNRAQRLTKEAHEEEVRKWERGLLTRKTKPRAADYAVDPNDIPDEDIVIRVMTFEHVPKEKRKTNPKTIADRHSKCNYPPFKQYAMIDGDWEEVVRSHWKGDKISGSFSVSHGKTNDALARMYIKLCERYSMRGNWRGYTYVDEMRGQALLQLAQIGLQFNEAKSQNPFAYYTAAINNSFTRVFNMEKRNQNIRDDLLEEEGLNPSFTRTFNAEWEQEQDRHIEGVEVDED